MKRLSELLPGALDQSEVLRAARAQVALRAWAGAVGPILADKTLPDRYERGTLWVSASGSAWAVETALRAEQIVERLNAIAGERGLFIDLKVSQRPPRRSSLL